MYVCMYVRMYVCMCHASSQLGIKHLTRLPTQHQIRTLCTCSVCVYICVCVYVCVCAHVCMYVHIDGWMDGCVGGRMYVLMTYSRHCTSYMYICIIYICM